MCDKSLGLRDLPDGGCEGLQSFLGEELDGGGLPEVCDVESGTDLGVTCSGQDVVGSGCIVAGCDGSVGSYEDRTCIPDLGQSVQGILGDDTEVLGCGLVHHLDGMIDVLCKDVTGVLERDLDDVLPGCVRGLLLDLLSYGKCQLFRVSDEDGSG